MFTAIQGQYSSVVRFVKVTVQMNARVYTCKANCTTLALYNTLAV